jgi:hypothetical protein
LLYYVRVQQSTSWSHILDLLGRVRIHDVLLVAILDSDCSDPTAGALSDVYLKLDSGYLQFVSVNNNGGLRVRHLERIDVQAYRDEFGQEAFPVSLGSLFLGESQSVKCSQMEYVTNEESDLGQGIVRCVEIVLDNGHRVALDPMWTSGVRIGNTDPWFQENLSGSWTFRHHTEVYS